MSIHGTKAGLSPEEMSLSFVKYIKEEEFTGTTLFENQNSQDPCPEGQTMGKKTTSQYKV